MIPQIRPNKISASVLVVLGLVALPFASRAEAKKTPPPEVKAAAPQELPTQKMTIGASEKATVPPCDPSGGFLHKSGDLILAGGRDASGAMQVWSSSAAMDKWTPVSGLSVPAFAAYAVRGQDAVFAGGLVDGKPVSTVSLLSVAGGVPKLTPLTSLPVAVAGAGAAVITDSKLKSDVLYVFGGASGLNPDTVTKDLWTLNLTKQGSAWEKGPEFPGQPRAFFGAIGQYNLLCIFGGIGADGQRLNETWAYRPRPLEATKEQGWKRMADAPSPMVRVSTVALGTSQVMIIGGERQGGTSGLLEKSLSSLVPTRPLLFHTLTDVWCAFDQDTDIAFPAVLRSGEKITLLGNSVTGAPLAKEIVLKRSVRNLAWQDYLVIVGYFVLLVGIGFYFSHQESSAEFSLGNRKVSWWAAGISMFATGASAISFMAIPALAFATNLVWTTPLLMMIPGFFVSAYLIFPLLRRMNLTSTYEYLEHRFGTELRLIASGQCIMIQTIGRAGIVLVLPALAINSVTGMNVNLCVILMGVLTSVYTAIGGFNSVIWTEVFQGILKFIAPVVMIMFAIFTLPGGCSEFVGTGTTYNKFDLAVLSWDATLPALFVLLFSQFLQWTVSIAGDQPMIQRVFSSPMADVRGVSLMSTVCGILIGFIVNVMGLAIFCWFRANPDKFDPTAANDQIVPMFVTQAMPAGFAGMIVAAIFASAMATVASGMNSVATIFMQDFYLRFFPDTPDARRLFLLRAISYGVGLIGTCVALILANMKLDSMMIVWSKTVALLGGGVVGVYSLGMFTKRATNTGAICGAIGSMIFTLCIREFTPLHWATYLPIAMLSCMGIGYIASYFTKQTKDLSGLTIFTPKVSEEETQAAAKA